MARSRLRLGGESGSTLIEVLVAVVIMGIAFVVIVGGIGIAIIGSDIQKQQAGADVALRTAAETVAYQPCASTYAPAPVQGFTLTVTVSYWNPGSKKFEASCSGTPPTDNGLQLVELTASSTSGRAASPITLRVVKRRP